MYQVELIGRLEEALQEERFERMKGEEMIIMEEMGVSEGLKESIILIIIIITLRITTNSLLKMTIKTMRP